MLLLTPREVVPLSVPTFVSLECSISSFILPPIPTLPMFLPAYAPVAPPHVALFSG